MREILYRGQRLNNGEWIEGNLLLSDDGKVARIIIWNNIGYDEYPVDPATVGQFTGATDKNGNKIFEGDILRYPPKNRLEENNYVSYEVFWHDNDCADRHIGWQMNRYHYHGNVCGTMNDFTTFLPKYTEKMIIVGNIFDMEGGKNG
jgi:uncharacterized phage protein (TIGR01671 family)